MADHTTLMNGRVTLIQSKDGLRASMDSVLLSSVVKANKGDAILDMGCGTGAVGLCVNERLKDCNLPITGIDIQDNMIDLARQNAKLNDLLDPQYLCSDISDKSIFEAEAFDHIVMNPPYYQDGTRQKSPDTAREKAYSGDLKIWIASALCWVRQGGSLNIIHRADALDDILTLMKGKFGAIEVWPVYSKPNEPAIRVLVRGLRNRKTPMTIHPPVILFKTNGQPSDQSDLILKNGTGLG
jgi:tRNA1(Val) A37 N6-methylase TrmN6